MIRKLFTILFFIALGFSTNGQPSALSIPFQKLFNNSSNVYIGQFVKEKKNGLGILKFKDGSIYIGDFTDNEIDGTGTIFAPLNNNIKNCPSCAIYVGSFKKGKKEGYGTCYNDAGMVIYHGQFSKDKPISTYPNEETSQNGFFSIIETHEKGLYIGEISHNGLPDGQGTIFYGNGNTFYGVYSNGNIRGVGIAFLSNGGWETYCFKKDGRILPISSSEEYAKIDEIRASVTKSLMKKSLSELSDILMELSNNLIDLSRSLQETVQTWPQASYTSIGASPNTNGRQSKTNQNASNSQKESSTDNSAIDKLPYSQIRRTYEFMYNQYVDILTSWKVFCKDYSQSERTRIQNEMRNIRKKVADIDPSSPMTKNLIEDWEGHCDK